MNAPAPAGGRGRPSRIGFITESFLDRHGTLFEGGAERHLYHLAREVQQMGTEVVVCQRSVVRDERTVDGIRVVGEPAPLHAVGRRLAQRALAEGCTHLHFQYLERVPSGLSPDRTTATFHAVYWDIPYDRRYREWYPHAWAARAALPLWRWQRWATALVGVSQCRRVLATDSGLLRLVQSHRPALRTRVQVIPNFSDLSASDVLDLPPAALAPLVEAKRSGHVVVLVPRNLSFVRGGAWLPEIVDAVLARTAGRRCRFFLTGVPVHVYGRGDRYVRLLYARIGSMRPERRAALVLLGGLAREHMATAYHLSDLVLIPTFGNEGASLAALESLAVGTPVVATNVGGLSDVVRDGFNGVLTPPDPDDLAAAVADLAADADRRTRLGRQGMELARVTATMDRWRADVAVFARHAGWVPTAKATS